MRIFLYLIILSCFSLTACTSSKNTDASASKLRQEKDRDVNSTEVDAGSGIDLASYLRRIPGVNVRGSGANATVRVRGNSSFNAVSEPLYVVDGTIMGTSLATIYNTINPDDIARVRVLKDASETARYGLQGGNGVIEFKLKKQ